MLGGVKEEKIYGDFMLGMYFNWVHTYTHTHSGHTIHTLFIPDPMHVAKIGKDGGI